MVRQQDTVCPVVGLVIKFIGKEGKNTALPKDTY